MQVSREQQCEGIVLLNLCPDKLPQPKNNWVIIRGPRSFPDAVESSPLTVNSFFSSYIYIYMSPECARLLNTEMEEGRSERRNSLRRDVSLTQDIHAESFKAQVRKNRNCSSLKVFFSRNSSFGFQGGYLTSLLGKGDDKRRKKTIPAGETKKAALDIL